MKNSRAFVCFAFWLAAFSGFCAQATGAEGSAKPEPFRIVGTSLHAEGDKAEWCLTFSRQLNLDDRSKLLTAVNLREEGRRKKLSLKDISFAPTEICLQNLEHQRRYDVLLRRIESAEGEKLAYAYDSVFVVPDRKPFLAFMAGSDLSILPRHVRQKAGAVASDPFDVGMAHVLRSVNVGQTRLTLYRVEDQDLFAQAWQQFILSNLSPSESLYFARTKGKVVFESDLIFGANPNVEQTLVAPLPPDSELSSGLYYLAAAPKDKEKNTPSLFAGQWFLVSDLRLSALMLPDGVKVFAGDLGTRAPASSVELRLLTREGDVLAKAQTGGDGVAFLPVDFGKIKEPVALLLGAKEAGDVDILDIGRDDSIRLGPLPLKALLHLDRETYVSGSTAVVGLRAEDQAGRPVEARDSVLKLLRPDRRVYSQQSVPADPAGLRFLNMPLPITGKAGVWSLSWQRADGGVLAERSFLLSPDMGGNRIEMSLAQREEEAESAAIQVKATDAKGKPLALTEGRLVLRPQRPKIQGRKGFIFGVVEDVAAMEIPFVTGPDGNARVKIPADRKSFGECDALAATVVLNGERSDEELAIPLRRFSSLVGIKTLTEGASFAENGLARFEVIAVDAGGKRRAEDNLRFLIFEEGRNFEWFPSEGHWDYKPLPQHRRIGGGVLSLSASEENVVSWPVTTGSFVLEITDENGRVLARQPFKAGRAAPYPKETETARLRFLSPPETLEEKQENKIKLELEAPAFVSVTAFDGRARVSIYRFMRAGVNEIALSPDESWGQQIVLRAQAQFVDSPVPTTATAHTAVHHARRDLGIEASVGRVLTSGAGVTIPVKIQKIQGRAPTFVSFVATPSPEAERGEDPPTVRVDRVPLDAEGRGQVRFNAPFFQGDLRLFFSAWNETQYAEKVMTVPAVPALAVEGNFPERFSLDDRAEVSLKIVAGALREGVYDYELNLPSGFVSEGAPLKGKVTLRKGENKILLFTVTAKEQTEEVARFDIFNSTGLRLSKNWPVSAREEHSSEWEEARRFLEPRQSLAFPESKRDKAIGLVAAGAFPEVAELLQRVALGKPHATDEIALWLEATRAWEGPIRAMGLIGEARLEALRANFLRQLQLRQNEDGGFSSFAPGGSSDMTATASALVALQGQAERPAALAAEWLVHKMQNTWFDESEREARALALEALSRTKRGDLSAVRYFAETSKEKGLSPKGCAFLALALTQGGDGEAAMEWIGKARAGFDTQKDQAWALLRLLAANDMVLPSEVEWLLTQFETRPTADTLEGAAWTLAALAQASARLGSWEARWGEEAVNETGFFVFKIAPDEPQKKLTAGARKLYLLEIREKDKKKKGEEPRATRKKAFSLVRKFLKADGEEVSFDLSLNEGSSYLLLLEGEKPAKQSPVLRFVLPKSAAFEVLPIKDPSLLEGVFAGLPEGLTKLDSLTELPSGYGFSLEATKPWRAALLLRAKRRGSYALPLLRVLSADGETLETDQNPFRFSVW